MQYFVASKTKPSPRWKQAFPQLLFSQNPAHMPSIFNGSIWLDISGLKAQERERWITELSSQPFPLVVLSSLPNDEEALWAVGKGAKGYAHSLTSPEQLNQIELVVSHQGFWVPPTVLQRLVRLSHQAAATTKPHNGVALERLSPRESMVAKVLITGASNAEIASALAITQRTVKAHISSMFSKLDVNDRVHLALLLSQHEASQGVFNVDSATPVDVQQPARPPSVTS
jgi:DNA-binding NarL/FixJ family response regulator